MTKQIKVLIVDADQNFRRQFKNEVLNLNHFSYEYFEAKEFSSALKILENEKADVLFLDQKLIKKNIKESILKLTHNSPNLTIIVLSENNDSIVYDELLELGIKDYINKNSLNDVELLRSIISATERIKLNNAIVSSNNFFHSTIDALSASVAIMDENGTILYVNKSWREFAFNNNAEMINEGLGLNYIAIAENSTDEDGIGIRVAEAVKDIINYKIDEFTIEYPCHSPKVKRWFTLYLTCFEQDKKRMIVASHENITIRKEAEEKIKTSDKIFNHSIDMLCIAGFDGYFKVLNPSWEKVLGWSIEELTSKPWNDFVYPEDIKRTENIKSEIINGVECYQFENRYVCKDGSIKWLSWNSFPYAEENIMFGVARDITEKKRQEIAMLTMNQAIEQSPVSIVVTNVEGKIEYVNPKFSAVTGYTREEVLGENPRVLKSGDKTDQDYKELWERITSKKEWHGEFYNKKKDGTSFWEEAKISPILDSEGNISHFVAVKEDITERKNYEKELIESKEQAEKSDRLKSEFLAQISHEIRTPLNTLLSFAALLKDDLQDSVTEDLSNTFQFMDQAGQRIMRTIELIIKMSELHTDNYDAEFRENDLIGLIEEIENKYKVMASEKGLTLQFIKQIGSAKLFFDRPSMYEVVSNIVDNAIKYTNEGSVKIHIKKSIMNKVLITISDTGIGISEEYFNNIFKPFSQETSGYCRKYDGNGLGLALVKEYCKINNVEVFMKSEKDVSTEFTLIFR